MASLVRLLRDPLRLWQGFAVAIRMLQPHMPACSSLSIAFDGEYALNRSAVWAVMPRRSFTIS